MEDIYKFWIDNKYNKRQNNGKEKFTLIIPPPNVNGYLHIGHFLNATYQDILYRYKKMNDYDCLWTFGTDHGGISTEFMIKKELQRNNINKYDLGKEKYLEFANAFKENKRINMIEQLQKLGCLCDWDDEAYTLSDRFSDFVKNTFTHLYNNNLIYRKMAIVNYCVYCKTCLSDCEVTHIENKSKLYYIKYKICDSDEFVIVATTRPETIFGDTALCFNNDDEKYKKYLGKFAVVPLINRKIPFITHESIDPTYGTGLLKITPAHSKIDYEIGVKNNLEIINIITKDGFIKNTGTKYDNMKIINVKKNIINDLDIVKIKDITNSTSHCYKCENLIENIMSYQWFVSMKTIIKKVLENFDNIEFYPSSSKKVLKNMLKEERDWCISRQIWWGHTIPAFECDTCFNSSLENSICNNCGTPLNKSNDVLDTWFSSSLWSFVNNDQISVIISGKDILFFWIARMVMMSLEIKNTIPFKHIFLHGIVRDSKGAKMSKSKNNTIDPRDIINKYNADILRYSIIFHAAYDSDVKLSDNSFKVGKSIYIKLTNVYKFIEPFLIFADSTIPIYDDIDLWIIHKINECKIKYDHYLNIYKFSKALKVITTCFYDNFCSTYIELLKGKTNSNKILSYITIFSNILALFHPFMPFITEDLFSKLNKITSSIMDYKYIIINANNIPYIDEFINIKSYWINNNIDVENCSEELKNFVNQNENNINRLCKKEYN